MRFIKTIFMVLINFFPVVLGEIWHRKALRWLFILIILGASGGGGYWLWKNKDFGGKPGTEKEVTLAEAAKMGEVTTHKLMVQIEVPKGNPEDIKGRYQRGDIVLIKNGDFQFSPAETSGFLILKMDLTEKQAEVLVASKMEESDEKDEEGNPIMTSVARRKYVVDLRKIGIGEDDQKGREVDQIYKWDIVNEKEF